MREVPRKMRNLFLAIMVAGWICRPGDARAAETSTVFEPGPGKPVEGDIVYPPAPDEPRIRLLSTFQKPGDFRRDKPGWWSKVVDYLLGREKERGVAFITPYGIAVASGKAYVTDTEGASVAVVDLKTGRLDRLGDTPDGKLTTAIGVAVDSGGTVYVTDSGMDCVKVFGPDRKFLLKIGKKGELSRPTGIAWDGARNRIYVADTGNRRVVGYSPDGTLKVSFGRSGLGEGSMGSPVNLAVASDGTVLITDPIRANVQMWSSDGAFKGQFGESGNSPGYFHRPKGIALDSEGNIYVVDAMFGNVQIFNREGQVLMFFGDQGVAPGLFQLPAGICIDEKDRIFVADTLNRRIQVFQYLKKP